MKAQPDLLERKRPMPRNGTTTHTAAGKTRSFAEWEKAARSARKDALKHGQLELLDETPQGYAPTE